MGDGSATGTYTSVDYGSGSQNVLMGRGSNARPVVDSGVNNVFNSASWDGAALAAQWVFSCGVSTSQTSQDNRVNGIGTVVYTTNYSGGTFWLSKDGPWGDGSVDFTGTINSLIRITTLQYAADYTVTVTENINTSGNFDGSNCLMTCRDHQRHRWRHELLANQLGLSPLAGHRVHAQRHQR